MVSRLGNVGLLFLPLTLDEKAQGDLVWSHWGVVSIRLPIHLLLQTGQHCASFVDLT